ncbi:hypothetical protein [Cellulomonas sp. HD19AZ1]|uniref:hypothetical protein n=1 Tax=Cellulomonas sp. HD19AZ1 TaxID=2559593 RepID=UPI001070A613|nr:hypothetical protein [Cellulomonas sp. HD19AZ1]TFH68195.1 hypothetical protein E4A51_16910 [Cellulomonas sp. HD19AZ1]
MSARTYALPPAPRGRRSPAATLTTAEQITAVFTHRALYEMAAAVPERDRIGRPRKFPTYLILGFAVLQRIYRSGARAEHELTDPTTWSTVRAAITTAQADFDDLSIPDPGPGPGPEPPHWQAFRYARNRYLTDPDVQADLVEVFTWHAVRQAREMGLLEPAGPGSLCHPDTTRTVYGDSTVIRPMYRPPAARRTTDPTTGSPAITYLDPAGRPIDKPTRRFDPDVAEYHGHTGPVHGQIFVAWSVRGPGPHQRVVLTVGRVQRPGQEADDAMAAFWPLHAIAGAGIQAVVYDGAMRGAHIDELMTRADVVVINKVHASSKTAARRGKTTKPRWFTLGTWQHDAATGPCTHQLAAVDGAVSEIGLDEAGRPVVLGRLHRAQVKRPRRSSGRFHFNVGYTVPCPQGAFPAWVTPHGATGDTGVCCTSR